MLYPNDMPPKNNRFPLFGHSKILTPLLNRRAQNRRIFICIIIYFITLSLCGCFLPLPAPTILDKPFKDEIKSSIILGTTTKKEVINILGSPDATRQNDTIYIYAKPYVYMKFLVLLNLNYGSLRDFQRHRLLIIQFDKNDVVKCMDQITGNDEETVNKIYVADTGLRAKVLELYGTGFTPVQAPVNLMLVLYSPNSADTLAKNFSVPPGKSAIYLYRETSYLDYLNWCLPENAILKVSIRLDGTDLGDFGAEGFFYWIVDPGPHSLTVVPIYPTPRKYRPDNCTIELGESETAFVELSWEHKGFLKDELHAHFNRVTNFDEAQREIFKRRMILDCLTTVEE